MMNLYVSMTEEMEGETQTNRSYVQHIHQRIRYILLFVLLILVLFIGTLLFVNLSPSECGHKTLLSSQCPRVSSSMLQPGINFGAAAYTYRLTTASTIELTTTQALLLSLVNCLVTGDMNTCSILAECSQNIHQLKSRHLSLWLKEDFRFTKKDMQVAMAQLDKLVTNGSLKMPSHALTIISSLAEEYGIKLQSKESSDYLTQEERKAVSDNTGCKIICIATKRENVNGSTQSESSLVDLAVKNGTLSTAEHGFLKADFEVHKVGDHTRLEEAIKNNSAPSIRELLLAGANIKQRLSGGNSYLHIAAAAGKNGALQALLEAGLDPSTRNHLGEIPLVLAVKAGNVQGADILLQRVVNTSLETEMRNCLSMAVASSDVDMLQVLLKYKNLKDLRFENDDTIAHLIVRSSNAAEMLKLLKDHRVPLNIRNKEGLAPLHIATDPSVVKMLLDLGADVNFTTRNGETALHRSAQRGHIDIVKELLDHEADLTAKNNGGWTPLMEASHRGYLDIVKLLIGRGAPLNDRNNDGQIALHIASKGGHFGVVVELLDHGEDPTTKTNYDWTPLMEASYFGHFDIVKLLIGQGVPLNDKDCDGDTALHKAAQRGHVDIVKELLNHGADVTGKNDGGWTPLMEASHRGYLDIVKLLMGRGAPLDDKANNGDTALHKAVRKGHIEVVKELNRQT